MAAQFQFVMRAGPNAGKIYPLEGMEIIIGRDTGNTIAINDAEVSRKHAKLVWQESGYIIEDLGSTNGTFINGQRVNAPHLLQAGEVIAFGESIVLMYETCADPNATMVSSSARAAAASRPQPQPQPVAKPPTPPAYAGQVPAGPQMPYALPEKKKLSPWLLVAIIAAVVICLCIVFFVVIDQWSLWCTFFPFLFPNAC